MRGRRLAVAVAAIAVCAVGIGTASGAPRETARASAEAEASAIAIATVADATRYLRARGYDPAGFAIQRGNRNYAGPTCPGRAWSCTKARRVIQLARSASSSNRFECEPAQEPETDPATNTCVIVQVSAAGNNHARCHLRDTDVPAPPAVLAQRCEVTQTNAAGSNHAHIHMDIDQRAGSVQRARQSADVTQTNQTGDNHLQSLQDIRQDAKVGAIQTQEAQQEVRVDQDATAGSNFSHARQAQSESAKSQLNAVSQCQNGSPDFGGSNPACGTEVLVGPDMEADVNQSSQSGRNHSKLDQSSDLSAHARRNATGPVFQTQGSPGGPILGAVFQETADPADNKSDAREVSRQWMAGPEGAVQVQDPSLDCCSTQLPGGSVNIDQTVDQTALGGVYSQTVSIDGHCFTPAGNCVISQTARTNDARSHETFSGPILDVFTVCNSSGGEGACVSGDDPIFTD